MRVPQTIRCVIFDFDGVLVDSEPLHEWSIRESVSYLGWDFEHERFLSQIVGKGDENAYRLIAEWNRASASDEQIHAMLREKWSLMRRGIAERRYTVQPGAEAVVVAAAAKWPTGVCSGSVRDTVVAMLEHAGLRGHMREVVCADDVTRVKPDPEGYLKCASLLGVEPAGCLVVEDTPTGVKAGKAAGMFVVGVCHTVKAAALGEADMVLERIADLEL